MLNSFFDKFIFTNGLNFKDNKFLLLNIPLVIVPAELLVALSASNDEKLHRALYYLIKERTRTELFNQFHLHLGSEDFSQTMKVFEEFLSASGWGAIKNIDIDEKGRRAIIVVTNSPIAEALHGKVEWEVDHFLRGVFAGLFSRLFRENLECVEHKCAALNEKECEFVVKQQHTFDIAEKQVRRQLEFG